MRVVSAGIASVGAAFGFARYGYGLLLPDIRADYALSSAALGAIATGSYVGYLTATAASPVLAVRLGTRGTVALGLALAVAGMALIGLSSSAGLLATGILVAGASSGLVWVPFSDTVATDLPAGARDRALAAISSGTGWGVALAVPIALVAGTAWRSAWLAFAVLALAALLWSLRVLPGRISAAAASGLPPLRPGWFVCPRSGPLLAGSFLIGLGASARRRTGRSPSTTSCRPAAPTPATRGSCSRSSAWRASSARSPPTSSGTPAVAPAWLRLPSR